MPFSAAKGSPLSSAIGSSPSVSYTYADGQIASMSRSAAGGDQTVTQTYAMSYDNFGNMVSVNVGSRNLATYSYGDANGNLSELLYANGDSVSYEYDELERVSDVYYNDDVQDPAVSYSYSSNGALSRVDDYASGRDYVYNYDALGRLTSMAERYGSYGVQIYRSAFDGANRVSSVDYRVSPAWNGTFRDVRTYSYTYDDGNGSLSSMGLPANGTYTYSYDALQRLTGRTLKLGDSNFLTRSYSFVPGTGTDGTTMMIDIKLTVLKDCEREILNATRLHLYHGARDVLCKIVLLDRDSISAGESCYAQLRLEEEIAVKTGDRFVLRFYSPLETIGGGVVLDSNPFKHKRNDPQVLESLNIKENGSDKEKISAALKDYSSRFETLDFLQVQTAIPKEQFDQQIQKLIKDKIAFRISDNVVIHVDYLNHLKDVAVKMLTAYHAENPLRDGMKRDEFRGKFIKYEDMSVVDKITDSLVNRKVLKIVNGCVALYDFEAQTDNNQELIEKAFYEGGFSPESPDQIAARFPKIKNFKAVLEALVNSGKLVRVEDKILLHVDYYNKALEMAKEHIAKNGQITLAEMRDLMGASRKFAVAVLEYWDRRNITKKVGDARVLK